MGAISGSSSRERRERGGGTQTVRKSVGQKHFRGVFQESLNLVPSNQPRHTIFPRAQRERRSVPSPKRELVALLPRARRETNWRVGLAEPNREFPRSEKGFWHSCIVLQGGSERGGRNDPTIIQLPSTTPLVTTSARLFLFLLFLFFKSWEKDWGYDA